MDSAGRRNTNAGLRAGGCRIIITEERTPFHNVADFSRAGIDVASCALVVVKIGYLVPELKRAAAAAYLALSPGAVDQRLAELPFSRIRRPSFPFDRDMSVDLNSLLVTVASG